MASRHLGTTQTESGCYYIIVLFYYYSIIIIIIIIIITIPWLAAIWAPRRRCLVINIIIIILLILYCYIYRGVILAPRSVSWILLLLSYNCKYYHYYIISFL